MEEEIKQYIYDNGMIATSKKFGLSPFKIRQIVPWGRKERAAWFLRQGIKLHEVRRQRRAEVTRIRTAKPEVRKRTNFLHRRLNRRRAFWSIAKKLRTKKPNDPQNATILDLFSIAKKQRLICPYTGLKLTRDTMSIEHIVPLSKGGTNAKENLMFVHIWANKMKLNYPLDEFKEMITRIYSTLCSSSVDSTRL